MKMDDLNKLTVRKISGLLASRGLDTTGLKQTLVSRLAAAMTSEVEASNGQNSSLPATNKVAAMNGEKSSSQAIEISEENGKKEKKRKADTVNRHVNIEDVEDMPISELKAALTDLGCSTTGAKLALKKRLTSALKARDSLTTSDAHASEGDDDDASKSHFAKIDNVDIMTVSELREALSVLGCSTSGAKDALKARLVAFKAKDTVKKSDSEIGNVDNMTISELRDALSDLGCSNTGEKNALKERLVTAIEAKDPAKKSDPGTRKGDRVDESNRIPMKMEDVDSMQTSELRGVLSNLGCPTAGGKNALKKRLIAALGDQESVQKSNGDTENPDESMRKPVKIEDVGNMQLVELKDALAALGCPSSGSKNALKTRLLAALGAQDSVKELNRDTGEGGTDPTETKIITKIKKGSAVLDPQLPEGIKSRFHVVERDAVYDAVLNQTNVDGNNNKFYIIQALESDVGGQYKVFTRWGRVGAIGQHKLLECHDLNNCVAQFQRIFHEKTKNHWNSRHKFIPHHGKYTWLEMDYEPEQKKSETAGTSKSISKLPSASKLNIQVLELITLICNINMMKQQMIELGYDAKKMPLGKLSKTTVRMGFEVLKRIAAALDSGDNSDIKQLSSDFYTVIPHDFGYKKMKEFVISTHEMLKTKLEMVEALGEIELASKILDTNEDEEDPAFEHYKRLKCEIEPVPMDSEDAHWIKSYVDNTHGETHSSYRLKVHQIFRLVREGEDSRFDEFSSTSNRMLLWHGSRLCNWTGILSQGLRIAPPEAPVTGYMFGKGVYFADMVSKSANYCCVSNDKPTGILLLSEVALGDSQELLQANYNANQLPKGKLSTKGVGRVCPTPEESKILPNGVIVPLGKPQTSVPGASLWYNEYIVYNPAQIRMKYLLMVNFIY